MRKHIVMLTPLIILTGVVTVTDHALYGTNTADRINGLGGNDIRYRDAKNDECVAHRLQGEMRVA